MQLFVVVSGLPGSGKTTLAAALAACLHAEHLDKDQFLEAHFLEEVDISVERRNELSRRADDEFRERALLLRSAVLSSWWRHPRAVRQSGTPVHWLNASGIKIVEVFCECPAEVAAHRFESRRRHPGHLDALRTRKELLEQLVEAETLGPLFPGAALVCNTVAPTSPDVVSALASQVRFLAGTTNEARLATRSS